MCHPKKTYNLTLRSSAGLSNQTFNCAEFVQRHIDPKKRYLLKVIYFGTSADQGALSNVVLHLNFFKTDNSQVVGTTELNSNPALILHHQANSNFLVYDGGAQTQYIGYFTNGLFNVSLTQSDFVTAQTLAGGSTWALQLQIEEFEDAM